MILDKYLKKIYNFPDNHNDISILDRLKIDKNFIKYQEYLNNLSKDNLTNIEKNIIELETNNFRYLMYLIDQTYFNNYYLEIYTYINGLITEKNNNMLNNLFESKDIIFKTADIIISKFEIIQSKNYYMSDEYDLNLYYQPFMIKKMINSLNFNLDTEDIKIKIIFETFLESINKVKKYLLDILNRNIFKERTKFGLSNFKIDFYLFYLKYNVGLNFKDENQIKKLYLWAYKCLKFNKKQVSNIVKKLYPDEYLLKKKKYHKLIKLVTDDYKYNFLSIDEVNDIYNNQLDEMYKLIDIHNVPNTIKCKFMTISNAEFATAFYTKDYFYLNTYNWKQYKKYEVKTLVMHEAYPGHHMQIDIINNFTSLSYLATLYDYIFNTFIEGWGLFSESLSSDYNLIDTFGRLDANMLRTLRIMADIDIHYFGKSPEQVIKYMSKYLALDISIITSEVYRYIALPAQAISYKIGEMAFMGIYCELTKKNKLKIDDKLMFKEYIKILKNGILSLDDLLLLYDLEIKL
jgi:hypothetical protein